MKIRLLVLLLGILHTGWAQPFSLQYPKNGKFKIVQITDVHYIHDNPESNIAIERINEILDAENPNLVIFTGDIIFGNPAQKNMTTILELASKRKIPFVITFGNHDDEYDLSRRQLFDLIQSIPYNITQTISGISGITNCVLPILSSTQNKPANLLYILDSNSYSEIPDIKGYGHIKIDQIQWYVATSKKFTVQNGNKPIPSIAFFHIPLPEYALAASSENAILIGTRKEISCPPILNSGLFSAMKEMKDVQGIFVGHDHDNDYAVDYYGILLAYGRYSGGNTVYNNLSNGARVIELTEGESGFYTWIRLKNNEIIHHIHYPTDYIKKKE